MGRARGGVGWCGLLWVALAPGCGSSGSHGIEEVEHVDRADGGPADAQAVPQPDMPTACRIELGRRGVAFLPDPRELQRPAGRPDLECHVEDPVSLQPVIHGITFRQERIEPAPTTLYSSCALALAIERMAAMLAERGVAEVVHFGIYGCRLIAGTDLLSQHARARALDIGALRLTSGTTYTVITDWEKNQPAPVTPGGRFLREILTALFDAGTFNIVLTPDFNAEHHDHFHLDLTPEMRLFR